jgi:hypothetical protein
MELQYRSQTLNNPHIREANPLQEEKKKDIYNGTVTFTP